MTQQQFQQLMQAIMNHPKLRQLVQNNPRLWQQLQSRMASGAGQQQTQGQPYTVPAAFAPPTSAAPAPAAAQPPPQAEPVGPARPAPAPSNSTTPLQPPLNGGGVLSPVGPAPYIPPVTQQPVGPAQPTFNPKVDTGGSPVNPNLGGSGESDSHAQGGYDPEGSSMSTPPPTPQISTQPVGPAQPSQPTQQPVGPAWPTGGPPQVPPGGIPGAPVGGGVGRFPFNPPAPGMGQGVDINQLQQQLQQILKNLPYRIPGQVG